MEKQSRLSLAVVGSAMAIFHNGWICGDAAAVATIVGGGDSVLSAVFDFANTRLKSFLIEHSPCSGRRVAQPRLPFSQHYGMLRRSASDHEYGCTRLSFSSTYLHHHLHSGIKILTNTHVIGNKGQVGDFTVSLRQGPNEELR